MRPSLSLSRARALSRIAPSHSLARSLAMRQAPLFPEEEAEPEQTAGDDQVLQKALKLETLKGFTPGHLATVGRRALGGSYDF